MWWKIIGMAMLCGIVAAALGFVALYGLTLGLTRLLYPEALRSAVYLKAMTGTDGYGLVLGAVTGIILSVPAEYTYIRRVVGWLCLWIGATVALPTLAIVTILVFTAQGNARAISGMVQPSGAVIICVMLPLLLWGSLLLWWSFKILVNRTWESLWQEFTEGARAVWLPHGGGDIEDLVLHSPLSVGVCCDRLDREADVEHGLFSRWLLRLPLPNRKPFVARINGTELRLRHRSGNLNHFVVGRLIPAADGTCLEMYSDMSLLDKVWFGLWFGMLSLFTIISTLALLSDGIAWLIGGTTHTENPQTFLSVLVLMWIIGTGLLRYHHWRARRQELRILGFLQRTLEADIVERHLRVRRFIIF